MIVAPVTIYIPKEVVSDDFYIVSELCCCDGDKVSKGDILGTIETSKSTVEIFSGGEGFVYYKCEEGDRIGVDSAFAVVSHLRLDPKDFEKNDRENTTSIPRTDVRISKSAMKLIIREEIDLSLFGDRKIISKKDVESVIKLEMEKKEVEKIFYGEEELDIESEWDDVLATPEYKMFSDMLLALRKRMKVKFKRHVPMGTLLSDRWELANNQNFGKGASVYDECLILGDVKVGANCWVGPYTILDGGNAPLTIGDYTSIGSGSHVYTHNTIDWALTGGVAPNFVKETVIGKCCFISPSVIIGPGSRIGDHSFVSMGSYVQGVFPSHSFISGNPARRVGTVKIEGKKVILLREDK